MRTCITALLALASLPVSATVQQRESLAPDRRGDEARSEIRGVVLDRELGEPVPGALIQIRQGERIEITETDEAGEFVVERATGASSVCVRAWDNADFESGGRHDTRCELLSELAPYPEGCAVPFRVHAGARYELDLALPAGVGLEDLEVGTRRRGSEPGRSWRRGHRLQIHGGERPWIRIPWTSRFGPAHTTLHVTTKDGRYAAVLDLPEPETLDGGVLSVRTRPMAVLTGQVPLPVGVHEAAGFATLEVRPLETGTGLRRPFRYVTPLGRPFRIGGIEPGRWEVVVTSPSFEGDRLEVVLPPAGEASVVPALGDARERGKLTLRIVDPEGPLPIWQDRRQAPELDATLRAEELPFWFTAKAKRTPSLCDGFGHRGPWFEPVWRAGRIVYEVTFEDLPDVEYTVQIEAGRLVDAPIRRARIGNTVDFEYESRDPDRAYRFQVVHEQTREAVRHYSIARAVPQRSEIPTPFPLSKDPVDGDVHAYALPDDEPVHWCLFKPGFERVYGDRRSFVPAQPPARGHVARIELRPGFGVRLEALDQDGRPLQGVDIEFDAAEFRTDEAGVAYLRSPSARPLTRLAVEGYDIVGGNVEPDGTFEFRAVGLELVLR